MQSKDRLYRLLIFCFLLETFCISYGLHFPAFGALLSILYSLSGLVLAFAFLFLPDLPAISQSFLKQPAFKWILLAIILDGMCWFGYQRMLAEPLAYETADMLPIIKVMNERLLAGHPMQVYDPIPQIWHGTVPIYLPAMWLPYALPLAAGIDLRWITIACLFVVFAIFILRNRFNMHGIFTAAGAALLLCWLFIDDMPGLLPFSEEGVVIFYYVLLVIALQRKNPWLTGIAIAICALSRYAFIGWLPALLLYMIWRKEWRALLRMSVAGFVTALVLVLPFGWKLLDSLVALPQSYIAFAGRVWHDSPEVFTEGPGLARFFGVRHIALQHSLLIVCVLILPVLATWVLLLKQKKWRIGTANIPIAMLKLSLVIFYSLVDVPYLYLFYTSSFVSLMMLSGYASEKVRIRNG
ncbi:MAG: hypothetical protein JO301_18150 [Chitinophagaceae bacterium]|nr:hypothetical protein [Chitinophagaceae bacterium]